MKFSLPKGLANIFRSAAKLDPSAQPFIPNPHEEATVSLADAANPNFAIYNDGVPSLTPTSLKDVLAGINDEAIDENFAPDAREAAELEMVDHYVQELAKMDILEDREVRNDDLRTRLKFFSQLSLRFRSVLAKDSLISANAGRAAEPMALRQMKHLVNP